MLIKVDYKKDLDACLNRAADVLLSGGVVAFPTESFYGLAVNAMDDKAIHRLFAIKKREMDHPVLILIPSIEVLEKYTEHIPATAHKIIKQFWPGGLTLIFRAGRKISPLLTAGTGKVGIRLSSHPLATSLARVVGVPITGTSANISGQDACRNAEEVYNSLGKEVNIILDGGETQGGKGSTILDVTVTPHGILREGMVSGELLKRFL